MVTVRRSIADRIRDLVSQAAQTGCWEWQGSLNSGGYGQMSVGTRTDGTRKTALAHRVSYEAFVGAIPEGLVIDHLCRNKACVNPAHLEPVTNKVNTHDRAVYPNGMRGRFSGKTQCSTCGGELAVVNKRNGDKGCRPCRIKTATLWRHNNKERSREISVKYQLKKKGLQV